MMVDHRNSIKNSALWAAYGDALGFITEFCDKSSLQKRIGFSRVSKTVPWRHRVGGKYGTYVELPAGAYSDDTQLRLATSRAIRSDGNHDVEAFANVELTVWPAYALGGGRGTKSAASNIVSDNVNWFSNFFEGRSKYINAGGNGAAMRVQPLVWAAFSDPHPMRVLEDVFRNSITTHGHPVGLLGALFHASCLRYVMRNGEIPGPEIWETMIEKIVSYIGDILNEESIRDFWVPTWERVAGKRFRDEFQKCGLEMYNDIDVFVSILERDSEQVFWQFLREIGLFERMTMGAGTKSALAAVAVAWLHRESGAEGCVLEAANALGSDTDTIATMAGALAGATEGSAPENEVMDRAYIEWEAERLSRIGEHGDSPTFRYPDLFAWKPPRRQSDVCRVSEGKACVAGLGKGEVLSGMKDERVRHDGSSTGLEWVRLTFGQTILSKTRYADGQDFNTVLGGFYEEQTMGERHPVSSVQREKQGYNLRNRKEKMPKSEPELGLTKGNDRQSDSSSIDARDGHSIDKMTKNAIKSGFEARQLGEDLKRLAMQDDGIEKSLGYVAIIAKALRSRKGKD